MLLSFYNASANVHYPRSVGRHNVSNLMYVPLTALNASADPTAIVCSNHVPMNQSYTVSTEAVCPKSNQIVLVTYTWLADVFASVVKCLCL